MNLVELKRIFRGPKYTIGKLYVNGKYICDTLEDPDRDLNRNGVFDGDEEKIWRDTAIPNGDYEIEFRYSPSFSRRYGGKEMPYVINVPHFEGILFHWGNTAKDTHGCILVGQNTKVGMVLNSKITFDKVYDQLRSLKGGINLKVY